MAAKPISMLDIRRILQLLKANTSKRSISRQTELPRNTVKKYVRLIAQLNVPIDDLLLMEDEQLSVLIFDYGGASSLPFDIRYEELQKKFPSFKKDLENKHVTRQLLWNEYRLEHPTGYEYSRFCHHLNEFMVSKDVTMPMVHYPGEKLLIDFAGKTMSYFKSDGEEVKCQIFVAVFPFSGYTFTYAVHSQKQADFLLCLEKSLCYFGGVPGCIVGDNLKSYVKKSNRYEPEFTDLMLQFSVHYNTTLMAARVRKPKDKASVERTVRLAYERVYAPLRNHRFTCIEDINASIVGQLEHHHHRKFRGEEENREQLFLSKELPCLKELPTSTMEVKQTVMAKVQKNYHIVLGQDWHFYSVPHQYTGKEVKVEYTFSHVEIYCQHQRIAVHARIHNSRRNIYATDKQHMPENHKHYSEQMGWDADYFKTQAAKIAPEVELVIDKVLNTRVFPQQAFNTCIGILRLSGKYGSGRLMKACRMALKANSVNYKFISNVLSNSTDKRWVESTNIPPEVIIPHHDNLRGAGFYQ